MKIIFSSVFVAMLCGPALADPPPQPTLQLKLAVTSDTGTRRYDLKLVEKSCGKVDNSTATTRDEIHACIASDPAGLRLEIEWSLRDRDRALDNKSTLIAKRGDSFELVHAGAKLAVTLQ